MEYEQDAAALISCNGPGGGVLYRDTRNSVAEKCIFRQIFLSASFKM